MKNLIIGSVVVLAGLGVMGAAGGSPKKTLETYLSSTAGSEKMYETICDKDIISHGEFKAFYNSPSGKHKANFQTNNIKKTETAGRITYLDADHVDRGESHTSSYAVRSQPDGGYCVEWARGGRVIGDLEDLIRYPNDKITAFFPVELTDYYNYDFDESARTHMALNIDNGVAGGWSTIYIPYNGNEELYEYVKNTKNPVIKGVVSREYVTDLDPDVVDKYNKQLYSSAREVNSIARDIGAEEWEPTYLRYSYSHTTDDPSILYMPTAVPASGRG